VTAVLPDNPARATFRRPGFVDIEAVYREYGGNCYRLALRLVRDPDLAHDVVQNVFESLARQPDRFQPDRGTLLTWLLTLTHHKAVDLIRWQRSRTRNDTTDDCLVELYTQQPGPEQAATTSDDRARVLAALRRLIPAERELLVLAYFGGYTQREIAERTGLPLGTVKGRTVSAMRHMRTNLESS
jgi:RNA polymerase sigma factor (sigma-70 family)